MKNNKPIERILKLLFYLNNPFGHTLEECIDTLLISKSTFYEYREKLADVGFFIQLENGKYRFDATKSDNSWFTNLLHISDEDAYLFSKAIDKLDISVPKAQSLKNRLLKIFDNGLYAEQIARQSEKNVTAFLIDAIQNQKQVLLCGYHSGNSQTITDRLVEPFQLSDSFNLVWCYDVEKNANRQFKISRIDRVEISPMDWEFKHLHKTTPTDIFRNTGILDKQVEIMLNLRATNLLIEEYPMAEQHLKKQNDRMFLFQCNVAMYVGPCRFVLGLWDDVEIIGDSNFKNFVQQKIRKLNTSPENSEYKKLL
jgi:predicted DNA-binding transcriptional regulator YafY